MDDNVKQARTDMINIVKFRVPAKVYHDFMKALSVYEELLDQTAYTEGYTEAFDDKKKKL